MIDKRVLVLMSTYNGERFLQQQLDSLYAQNLKADILIRDDGSTDQTLEILKNNSDSIKYYTGENLGCCHSFLNLVKTAPDDYDYYFFCDQDDIWLPEKIYEAVKTLESKNSDQPLLYFSALTTIDENNNVIDKLIQTCPTKIEKYTFSRSLIKSYGFGCTMAFNAKLKALYSELDYPFIDSHDWLMQKIALLYGDIMYDDKSYILYRQHNNNICGIKQKRGFKGFLKKYQKGKYARSKIGNVILSTYKDIPNDKLKALSIIANAKKFRNRFKVIFSRKFKVFSFKTNFSISVYSLLGWL